jgi:hypothetical protein
MPKKKSNDDNVRIALNVTRQELASPNDRKVEAIRDFLVYKSIEDIFDKDKQKRLDLDIKGDLVYDVYDAFGIDSTIERPKKEHYVYIDLNIAGVSKPVTLTLYTWRTSSTAWKSAFEQLRDGVIKAIEEVRNSKRASMAPKTIADLLEGKVLKLAKKLEEDKIDNSKQSIKIGDLPEDLDLRAEQMQLLPTLKQ